MKDEFFSSRAAEAEEIQDQSLAFEGGYYPWKCEKRVPLSFRWSLSFVMIKGFCFVMCFPLKSPVRVIIFALPHRLLPTKVNRHANYNLVPLSLSGASKGHKTSLASMTWRQKEKLHSLALLGTLENPGLGFLDH